MIDDDIYVAVLGMRGGTVRLGITAPASVPVDRREVHERRRPRPTGAPAACPGDRVQVHYRVRFQDGSTASSRGRAPLELTVGTPHHRLPGLGSALVGLAPGDHATLTVPPERAYGVPDPGRVGRWPRAHFPGTGALAAGTWVRLSQAPGQHRQGRVLQESNGEVLVDANHRWAGQALELDVEVVAVRGPDGGAPEGEQDGPGRWG